MWSGVDVPRAKAQKWIDVDTRRKVTKPENCGRRSWMSHNNEVVVGVLATLL